MAAQQQVDDMVAAIAAMPAALAQGVANSLAAHPAAPAPAPRPRELTVAPLTEATPEAWKAWRTRFEATARLNEWDNARQRMVTFVSMQGAAGEAVAHLPHGVPPPPAAGAPAVACPAAADYLDELEARFMPPAAGDVARGMYRQAAQTEEETLGAWHSRLRALAIRAYPHRTPAEMEADPDLIRQFIEGMTNHQVMEGVLVARPLTYANALVEATTRMGIFLTMRAKKTGKRVDSTDLRANLFAMEKASPSGTSTNSLGAIQCYSCDKAGHLARDCPTPRACFECGRKGHLARDCRRRGQTSQRGRAPYQRTRGNIRGRGRGRARGGVSKGRGNNRRALNAMAAMEFIASFGADHDDYDEGPNHEMDDNPRQTHQKASENC